MTLNSFSLERINQSRIYDNVISEDFCDEEIFSERYLVSERRVQYCVDLTGDDEEPYNTSEKLCSEGSFARENSLSLLLIPQWPMLVDSIETCCFVCIIHGRSCLGIQKC